MPGVSGQYALRSVRRNFRRTLLSVLGIGVGCALALLVDSLNRGKDGLYVGTAAESGWGHVRVVPHGWRARRDLDLRLADAGADLAAARALPGVQVAVPRARAQVLLAMGTHVLPIEMVGVDALLEPQACRYVRHLRMGRYLQPGERDVVVIGKAAAERLGAGLGDELLVSVVGASGEIESAMCRVVGIVATGSEDFDAGICHVALADLERLTGRAGAGEVTVLLANWRDTPAARAALGSRVARGDEVLSWYELTPEFAGHLRQDTAASRLVTGIIILIVLIGVTSAQLAAVLERRREFAVLSALGMKAGPMVRLVLGEAVLLGLAGALVGMLLSVPVIWRWERAGLDFSSWMGERYTFEGIIVEPIIYGDFGPWLVPEALIIAVGATVLATLYPAWYAVRTDPAVALRVAQ